MKKSILSIIMLILSVFTLCSFTTKSTLDGSVIGDLSKDKTFDVSKYDYKTYNVSDPFYELIQIAETDNDRLCLYLYQPFDNIYETTATSIIFSTDDVTDIANAPGFYKYKLKLVSEEKTLHKYVVEDFTLKNENIRYYCISNIYRTLIPEIGETNSTLVEKAIGISQKWCVYNYNDKLKYEMATFETVEITPIFAGSVEFKNGLTIGDLVGSYKIGDSSFICFNVEDYVVKHIYDADIAFSHTLSEYYYDYRYPTQDVKPIGSTTYVPKRYLSDLDEVSFVGSGFLAKEYHWNRISSSEKFIKNYQEQNIRFSESTLEKIRSSQFVFSFYESEAKYQYNEYGYKKTFEKVSDINILRLHFLDINDNVYNLGVVMDTVEIDEIPDASGDGVDISEIEQVFRYVLLILGVVIVLALFGPFVPLLIKGIVTLIMLVFKFIFFVIKKILWLVFLPFTLIKKAVVKRNESKVKDGF